MILLLLISTSPVPIISTVTSKIPVIAVSQSTKPELMLSHLAKIKFLRSVTLFCQPVNVPPHVATCLGISGSITATILSKR